MFWTLHPCWEWSDVVFCTPPALTSGPSTELHERTMSRRRAPPAAQAILPLMGSLGLEACLAAAATATVLCAAYYIFARQRCLSSTELLLLQARKSISVLMRAITDTPSHAARRFNSKRGAALLAKFRTGTQTLDDLADVHALRGYVDAVGSKRVYNVCEVFARLVQHSEAQSRFADSLLRRDRPLRVASVGGGPASCLLGYTVFERLAARSRRPPSSSSSDSSAAEGGSSPRLHVFDYAVGWEPFVERASDALAEAVSFGLCDLTHSLTHASNEALRSAFATGLDLVLLVHTLHEADHDRPGLDASGREPRWAKLLLQMWDAAAPASIFLIKDQRWVERRALELLAGRRAQTLAASHTVLRAAGVRSAANDSDGLFLLRT